MNFVRLMLSLRVADVIAYLFLWWQMLSHLIELWQMYCHWILPIDIYCIGRLVRKVVSSTDSSAKGWTVKMNTLGSHQEPLVKGIKSTSRPPPQYMTIIPPQVMKPALKISALWGGRIKISSEPLKRQFILGEQSIPKQKHWQIPSATYMGWGSVEQLRTQVKITSTQWL